MPGQDVTAEPVDNRYQIQETFSQADIRDMCTPDLIGSIDSYQVKQTGKGVRILPFLLPTQSPWLNPIEPKWMHARRNAVELDSLLTARQLAERVCAYFGCSYESHLVVPEKVT